MAMEIKTLDVANSKEAETIEFWAQFGWSLKSSQRVYNKDSHLKSSGDSVYSVTETVDFTKLVFERDKNHPHYAEITELEREYLDKERQYNKMSSVDTSIASPLEWGKKHFQIGDARSKKMKIMNMILILLGVALMLSYLLIANGIEGEEIPPAITALDLAGFFIVIASVIVRIQGKTKSKEKVLKHLIQSPDTPLGTEFKKQYAAYCDEKNVTESEKLALAYRMKAILKELDAII